MNKLNGIITEVISEGHLSVVRIKAGDNMVTSIVVDTPATAPYLTEGNQVNILFKENEVVIAKSFTGLISMQNKFDCVIQSLEEGKLLCKVVLRCGSVEIASLITAHACGQLNLSPRDQVTAMVKTNEISLSPV